MKKYLLIICLVFLLFTSSCKKKDKPIDVPQTPEDPTKEETKYEKPNISLTKDYYVVGETLSFNCSNYKLDELFVQIDDQNCLKDDGDYKYTVRRKGNYKLTFMVREDPDTYTDVYVDFYAATFDIDTTTNTFGVGEKCEVWIFSFDNLYESSLDDFELSASNENVSIDGFTLTGKTIGDVKLTLTSKLNANVKSSYDIKVGDPATDLFLSPSCGLNTIKVGDIIDVDISLDYEISDYTWLNSDREILRVTKYDTALQITAISEGEARFSCYLKDNPKIKATYLIKVKGVADVDYIDRLIKLAYSEVGTWEGKDDNGEYNNVQKYGAWYNNNGEPWCATFVSWCWFHAGLSNELLLKYQGCYTGMEWMASHGIFHDIRGDYYPKEDYTPKSGDIVMFLSNGGSHTGIVGYADDTYIYTIEGNRSNHVEVWRIPRTNSKITGYASPNYPSCSARVDQSWLKTKIIDGHYIWVDVNTGLSTL